MQRHELSEEMKDNVAKMAALSSVTSLFYKGLMEDVLAINKELLYDKYKFHLLSKSSERKHVEKLIMKEYNGLKSAISLTISIMDSVDLRMRESVGDEVVDEIIDKLDCAMDGVTISELCKHLDK
jgi:hypothetical protein